MIYIKLLADRNSCFCEISQRQDREMTKVLMQQQNV